jgi:hypothetical protein
MENAVDCGRSIWRAGWRAGSSGGAPIWVNSMGKLHRCRSGYGNKISVSSPANDGLFAIFAEPSTRPAAHIT